MRIAGKWELCDDNVVRPIVRAQVSRVGGEMVAEDFLIDTGADRTVFSAALLSRMDLTSGDFQQESALCGIGGETNAVLVQALVQFHGEDGVPGRIRGEFAALTDPSATDLSVLGRDVLDCFDLVLSRRHNEILLLTSNHQYQVLEG